MGRVEKMGKGANKFEIDDRVGIAWINSACGKCYFCRKGDENLCDQFQGTGCDVDGGYAEYTLVSEDFVYRIPERFTDLEAAPLMCAGAIGWRALKLTGIKNGEILGLYGFGASAHIVIQIVKHCYPDSKVFVFTRKKGDEQSRLAEKLGADWVGVTGETPPERLNRAIDTTPVWTPPVEALKVLEKGGRLVMNLIRKEDWDREESLRKIEYPTHLWYEKEIKTVANITRKDVQEFFPLAAEIPIKPEITEFKLEEANKALIFLKQGKCRGAGVLRISD